MANEMRDMIKQAQEGGYEEGLLASTDLFDRIDELVELAAPRVMLHLSLAEAIAEKLVEIGEGDGDARGVVPEVRRLGRDLRDLILIQHGKILNS